MRPALTYAIAKFLGMIASTLVSASTPAHNRLHSFRAPLFHSIVFALPFPFSRTGILLPLLLAYFGHFARPFLL